MEIIGSLENASTIVIDVDDTCYNCPEYTAHWKEMKFSGIAELLDLTSEEAAVVVKKRKEALKLRYGRKFALTETVISLGINAREWNGLRNRLCPELFLVRDQELVDVILLAARSFSLVFATNSPEKLGRKILGLLGIIPEEIGCRFMATDMVNFYKPDPNFFLAASYLAKTRSRDCISIGNRFHTDCQPALNAGYMGAVVVSGGRNETVDILKQLL